MTQISMRKGMWFYFDYENHKIALHFSTWSGKEVVYIDDHIVSETRNMFRFTSRHSIMLGDTPLSIELEVENPFTYATEARLMKGRRVLQSQKASLFKMNKRSVAKLFAWLAAGMLGGYFAGYILAQLFKA
jgi:hypothetical protein